MTHASTPALITAAEMAGDWRLTTPGLPPCRLTLGTKAKANGYTLKADRACLARLGLPLPALWRPSSDGFALAAADERTIAFFAREKGGYFTWRDAAGRELRAERG